MAKLFKFRTQKLILNTHAALWLKLKTQKVKNLTFVISISSIRLSLKSMNVSIQARSPSHADIAVGPSAAKLTKSPTRKSISVV